ncbi:hypothetical protein, partial [Salmonella sp. s54395]|uniref:hypothetical protein n=1 Tax=Salmonella sp. s54395 TaxID=3159664 RepID=UPI003980D1AA
YFSHEAVLLWGEMVLFFFYLKISSFQNKEHNYNHWINFQIVVCNVATKTHKTLPIFTAKKMTLLVSNKGIPAALLN